MPERATKNTGERNDIWITEQANYSNWNGWKHIFMYYVWHRLSDALEKPPCGSPLLLTYVAILDGEQEIIDICPP